MIGAETIGTVNARCRCSRGCGTSSYRTLNAAAVDIGVVAGTGITLVLIDTMRPFAFGFDVSKQRVAARIKQQEN